MIAIVERVYCLCMYSGRHRLAGNQASGSYSSVGLKTEAVFDKH